MPVAPAMNQKIFSLGLAVETISAYLLCCALADEGRTITPDALGHVWAADAEALETALGELADHAILAPDADGTYRLLPVADWRKV